MEWTLQYTQNMEAESSLLGLILAVFMEYEEETWRLPRPHVSSKRVMPTALTDHATLNIFSTLAEYQVPYKPMGIVRQLERGNEDQRKFELMCRRQKEAAILHESHGHRNLISLVRDKGWN
jgi:hypothetical protein